MEVLIVSRTRTGTTRCIGGIVLDNNRSIRLEQSNGEYWPPDCVMRVGDVWDVEFINKPGVAPPFIEDVLVQRMVFVRHIDPLLPYILPLATQMQNCFWQGSLANLYACGGTVQFQSSNGKAFIEEGDEPDVSTGFWTPDRDLTLCADQKHYNYGFRQIAYVGDCTPLAVIPAGVLCRVSLGRLWSPPFADWVGPQRYYVQLSGWYM